MHTLNCYLIADPDGTPVLVGGTPGGDGQPQWNLQVVSGLIDAGLDVQAAIELPRWTVWPGTDPIDPPQPLRAARRGPPRRRRDRRPGPARPPRRPPRRLGRRRRRPADRPRPRDRRPRRRLRPARRVPSPWLLGNLRSTFAQNSPPPSTAPAPSSASASTPTPPASPPSSATCPLATPSPLQPRLIDATSDLVCAYKPNLAFYAALGSPAWRPCSPPATPSPRTSPSCSTARSTTWDPPPSAWARALFDTWAFDAITVNPYMGEDALAPVPLLPRPRRLRPSKTSNPGSGDFQDVSVGEDGHPLSSTSPAAPPAGPATTPPPSASSSAPPSPPQLGDVRAAGPDLPILVPGIGAQSGDISAAVTNGLDAAGAGLLVNSPPRVRQLCRAPAPTSPTQARSAATRLRDQINNRKTGPVTVVVCWGALLGLPALDSPRSTFRGPLLIQLSPLLPPSSPRTY